MQLKNRKSNTRQFPVADWQVGGNTFCLRNSETGRFGNCYWNRAEIQRNDYYLGIFQRWKIGSHGGGKSREVRWELKVERLSGQNIDKGELKIIGAEEKNLAQTLGQSGDLTYFIETSSEAKIMSLRVDATKISPYKKNTLIYTYHKL